MAGEYRFPNGVTKMCSHTFRLMHEHRSPLEKMASEPCLTLQERFELDRSRAQSEVLVKTGVSDFLKPDGPVL
jgi:hypothetical protein